MTDDNEQRRIDDPNDLVRLEIQTALEREIRVIPALVGGAAMPKPQMLPDPLLNLARRQAWVLNETSFQTDVARLIGELEKIFPKNEVIEINKAEDRREESEKRANDLFPIYGVSLGLTTIEEMAKLGKKNEDYECYNVGGLDFWCNDNQIVEGVDFTREQTPFPEKWQNLGFDWNLSYNQWLMLLNQLKCSIKIANPPSVDKWQDKSSFSAEIFATKRERIPILIELIFNYSKGTTTDSARTLYSLSIEVYKKDAGENDEH